MVLGFHTVDAKECSRTQLRSHIVLLTLIPVSREWSPAFSDKALRGYEQRMRGFRDKLFAQIAAFLGQPVNVSKWFNLYSFDVMGDLAFNSSFGMLEHKEEHWAIKILNEGLVPFKFVLPVYVFRLATAMPFVMRDWFKFLGYCHEKVEQRMRVSSHIRRIQ